MNAREFVEQVRKGNINVEEHTRKVIDEIENINSEYNYFNTISKELAIEQAKDIDKKIREGNTSGKLLGVPVSVKDCIVVKDVESRAGSKILSGYLPVFNATAVQKCIDEGAVIIGKTSQDEFGFGSFSTNVGVDMKIPLNPFDKERACGGSSGGAGGISQKISSVHIALGESTGGSIAAPASFCGVVGLCPTYGLVSRYGLMDYANSLDKIGPMAKTAEDCALMLEILAGKDERDSTSVDSKKEDYPSYLEKDGKKLKVAIIKEAFGEGTDEIISKKIKKTLENFGIEYEEIELPLNNKYSLPAYYLLSMTEASTNLAKYCGIRYGKAEKLEGNFNDYFSTVRSLNLGREAKRRIIIGTFARMSGFRDAYYLKAAKARTKLIEEYRKAFEKYDILISPTMPVLPPTFEEINKLTPLQNYMMDLMTGAPNLAGLPHISTTICFEKNLPVGMLMIADHFQEGKLLQFAKEFEK